MWHALLIDFRAVCYQERNVNVETQDVGSIAGGRGERPIVVITHFCLSWPLCLSLLLLFSPPLYSLSITDPVVHLAPLSALVFDLPHSSQSDMWVRVLPLLPPPLHYWHVRRGNTESPRPVCSIHVSSNTRCWSRLWLSGGAVSKTCLIPSNTRMEHACLLSGDEDVHSS